MVFGHLSLTVCVQAGLGLNQLVTCVISAVHR